MIQKWRELLNAVEIITEAKPMSESEIQAFEENIKFKLPIGYKEYLLFFGPGVFGENFIDIPFSDIESSEMNIGFFRDDNRDFESHLESQDSIDLDLWHKKCKEFNSLLDRAYVFGSSCKQESYVWDLSTYGELDQSYNIYLISLGSPDIYLVGRDFYEFIRDYCLGNKVFELLPQERWPNLEEVRPIFTGWGTQVPRADIIPTNLGTYLRKS